MVVLFLLILGTIIGSFLNVLILRLPEEETILGRSHCAKCGHQLYAMDLIPVLSFVWLGGRCRYCKQSISRRYIYVELMTGALFALAFYALGMQGTFPDLTGAQMLELIRAFFIISVMMVVFAIDYERYLILDKVLVYATTLIFVINIALDYLQMNVWGESYALVGLVSGLVLSLFFAALYFFSNGKWIGFGDVKLAWFIGLATPFPAIVATFFFAFMLGAVVSILLLIFRKKGLKSEMPLGTFLAISTVMVLFWGDGLVQKYFEIIGIR